ncbi:hypothetical protein DOY81_001601 [Sarcophaga bullata]|nr:hypothetical protein DOY81_001601 [Sarcophaga bullata]
MEEIICSKCGQSASFKCERCFEPYCSSQCQVSDWQDHKTKCYKFPNLIPLNMLKSLPSYWHLDKSAGNQRRHCGSTYSLNDTRSASTVSNSNKSKPKKLLNDNDFNMVAKAITPSPGGSNKSIVNTHCAVAEKSCTWSSAFPPSEGFFDAIIQYQEESECDKRIVWVTDIKYESSLRKLLTEINRSINQKVPCNPESIYEGALVAVPLDKILYRAVVLDNISEMRKATVRLIDYGNEIQVPYSQMFPAIPIMSNLNAYAFRVCLPDKYGPVEIESVITIKVVGEKQQDNYYNVECKTKSIPLHLPIELLNKGSVLTMVKCFPDNCNALLRLSNDVIGSQALEDVLNSAQTISFDFACVPNVGAFVAAKTSVGWKRARLLSFSEKLHKYLVYAIDDGFITLSKHIKKVPVEFATQPLGVFAISTTSPDCMLSEAMIATAKKLTLELLPTTSAMVGNELKTQLNCSLFDGDRKIMDTVVVSVFTGSFNELGLKLWHEKIPEGSKVYISHVLSYKEIFIASLENKEYHSIFMSEYEKCLPFASEDNIKLKDIVVAYNIRKETEYYRGQVIGCENNTLRLLNVDSGCEYYVKRVSVRKPTELINSLPVRCYRVKLMFLESIPTSVANNKALETLETCVENAVVFEITYGNKNCVDLLFVTKERQSLCKKLLPMVFEPAGNMLPTSATMLPENEELPMSPPNTPVTQNAITMAAEENVVASPKTNKSNHIFTIDDINVIPITCGDKIALYVLDPTTILNSESPYITAADYNNKAALAKMEECLQSVGEYCKSKKAPKGGYAPKKMEICLSVFADDGEWYRALCVDYKANDVFVVMFLDYGNLSKVHSKDIMPITEELMFPSNANMVYVEGINSKEQGMAFMKSVQKNPVIYASVTKLDDEDAYVAKILNTS